MKTRRRRRRRSVSCTTKSHEDRHIKELKENKFKLIVNVRRRKARQGKAKSLINSIYSILIGLKNKTVNMKSCCCVVVVLEEERVVG